MDYDGRGSVELSTKAEGEPRNGVAICVRAGFALALLFGSWAIVLIQLELRGDTVAFAYLAGGTALYLALAYIVRPQPNYRNLGFMGGLIDHPFRFSDGWNRFLLSLQLLLLPGRFIAGALIELLSLFRR